MVFLIGAFFALVRRELANRGLNAVGDWVGFDKAAQIHKIKK
jgi:hypothetical protein